MQRSKQQAIFFLLGAVLVGGALGFSADALLHEKPKHWAWRERMYEDLGMTAEQRSQADSMLDARNCQVEAVMKPVRLHLDSIRKVGQQQFLQILTAEQRQILHGRVQEMARRDSTRSKERGDRVSKPQPSCQ